MAYTPGSMEPTWGYNAAGEWVMLNQLEFTAWRDAEEAKREERMPREPMPPPPPMAPLTLESLQAGIAAIEAIPKSPFGPGRLAISSATARQFPCADGPAPPGVLDIEVNPYLPDHLFGVRQADG